jgi:NAD(P)-dependent dehydrogenase (short-subunit alcohol dehydrogenase family)
MAPRTWFITGSSSGFGREIALAALQRGDRVAATARHPESLDDLVASAPDRALAVRLDVTRADEIDAAVATAGAHFGGVDVLVNNAGHGSVGAVEEIEMADLRALMDTMFFGAIALTKAVLPQMRERRGGAIVQISSMGGQLSPPGFGAYCSAKFALEAMSESLATEVAPYGIRVVIVEPGSFRTEFGGGRMHYSRDSGFYTETAGENRAGIERIDGTQPGDPSKAAAAILEVLDAAHAPLRLALGADAVEAIRAKHERLRADLDRWEEISRATAIG